MLTLLLISSLAGLPGLFRFRLLLAVHALLVLDQLRLSLEIGNLVDGLTQSNVQ